MEQRTKIRYGTLFVLLTILLDIFARYLYKLSWLSNITIENNLNLFEVTLSLLEIITTLIIAWRITNKLSSVRYEKELSVDELKEHILSVRSFKRSISDVPDLAVAQNLLDDYAFLEQTIKTFHPNINTDSLKDSAFDLYFASTDLETRDLQLINQYSNNYVLTLKKHIKTINN